MGQGDSFEWKYRQIFAHSLVGIVSCDIDGHFLNCNPAFEKMLGYTSKELVQMKDGDITPASWNALDDESLRSKILREGSDTYEKEYVRKDGTIFPVEMSVNLIQNSEGTPVEFWGVARDISPRKRVESEINQKLRFEEILNNIISRFILEEQEFDIVLNQTLEYLGKFSGAYRAYVFLLQENRQFLDNTHEWCAKDVQSQIKELQAIDVKHFPWTFKQFEKTDLIHIEDPSILPIEAKDFREEMERQKIKSVLLVCLRAVDEIMGFVGFDCTYNIKRWSQMEINSLKVAAKVIAMSIKRKKIEKNCVLAKKNSV